MPTAKSLGYSDLSSMDPENNSPGKFGSWLRLSMMELREAGYRTTINRDAMNIYVAQNTPMILYSLNLNTFLLENPVYSSTFP